MTIVRDYARPPLVVWRALTDPALVPRWTSTGQGGRPEGFVPEVGTRFRFVGRPFPGWDGIVRCEVLAVDEPWLLSYSWRNKETDEPTIVTNRLAALPGGGTRLTWEHTGFRGVDGLPRVLDELDDSGRLRTGGAPLTDG
jgi:uncharacterized protein YndB with AHSA1/START domain